MRCVHVNMNVCGFVVVSAAVVIVLTLTRAERVVRCTLIRLMP